MKKYFSSVLCVMAIFSLIVSLVTPARALELGVRGYYWFPDLKGDLRMDGDGLEGSEIDVKDTLGISDESFPSVEVYAGIKKHHISFMYTQLDYSGSKYITQSINFLGKTYAANAFVESDFKAKMFDLEYQYDLINIENVLAGFSVGIIGEMSYIDGEASMRSSTIGSQYDQKETFQIPVPMLGIGAHIGVIKNILQGRLKASGMGYSGSVFFDAMAEISVTPFPFLDIHGGYRYMKFKVDDIEDVYADLEFAGPYIALTVGF